MEINVTASAQSEIEQQLAKYDLSTLKLVYDNEGCGCAVNGVAQLWMVPTTQASEDWLEAKSSAFQIMYSRKDAIYFEECLTIDYRAAGRAFILKSDNQIYNANFDLIAKGDLQ
jgi:uncharacterized protein YqkB